MEWVTGKEQSVGPLENQDADLVKQTIESLIRENKRRDESISKASTIIDAVHSENKLLRSKIKERDEVIEELKRQERLLENKVLSMETERLNMAKLRTVETKLRAEIEGLKHEIDLLSADSTQTQSEMRDKLAKAQKELKEERDTKERILAEIKELSNSEKVSSNLVEDYISQLRQIEDQNTMLADSLNKLREEHTKVIEQHRLEVASIKEAALNQLEILQSSRPSSITYSSLGKNITGSHLTKKGSDPHQGQNKGYSSGNAPPTFKGGFQHEDPHLSSRFGHSVIAPSAAKQTLMMDVIHSVVETHTKLCQHIGRFAEDESEEVRYMLDNCDRTLQMMSDKDLKSAEQKQLEALVELNSKLESTIFEQNDFIAELAQTNKQASQTIQELISERDRQASVLADAARDTLEACRHQTHIVGQFGAQTSQKLREELKKVDEVLSAVPTSTDSRTQLSQSQKAREVVQQLRDSQSKLGKMTSERDELISKMEDLLAEMGHKNKDLDDLTEVIDRMEQEMGDLKNCAASFEKRTVELEKMVKQAHLRVEELENENRRLIQKCEDLSLKSVQKAPRDGHFPQELSGYKSAAETREREENILLVKQLKNEINELKFEVRERDLEIENLRGEIEQKKTNQVQLLEDQHSFRANERNLLKEVSVLKAQNQELSKALANASTSTLKKGELEDTEAYDPEDSFKTLTGRSRLQRTATYQPIMNPHPPSNNYSRDYGELRRSSLERTDQRSGPGSNLNSTGFSQVLYDTSSRALAERARPGYSNLAEQNFDSRYNRNEPLPDYQREEQRYGRPGNLRSSLEASSTSKYPTNPAREWMSFKKHPQEGYFSEAEQKHRFGSQEHSGNYTANLPARGSRLRQVARTGKEVVEDITDEDLDEFERDLMTNSAFD